MSGVNLRSASGYSLFCLQFVLSVRFFPPLSESFLYFSWVPLESSEFAVVAGQLVKELVAM